MLQDRSMTDLKDMINISLVPAWSRFGKAHIAQSASDLHQLLASVIGVGVPVFDVVGFQELGTVKTVEFLLADQVDGWDVDDVHDGSPFGKIIPGDCNRLGFR